MLDERGLALAREIGDREKVAIATGNLGYDYHLLGRTAEARTALDHALALSREIGVRRHVGTWLHGLAELAADEGRDDEAAAGFRAAIELRDAVGERFGAAESRAALGALLAAGGRVEEACALLDSARTAALELGVPGTELLALAHLAALPGGDVRAAEQALARLEDRLEVHARMDAGLALWRAAGGREHLARAKRLLDEVLSSNPSECRESMLANVRLHREIATAAREAGL